MVSDTQSIDDEIASIKKHILRMRQAGRIGQDMFASFQRQKEERQIKIQARIAHLLWETIDLTRYMNQFLEYSFYDSKEVLLQQAYLCCVTHRYAMLLRQHAITIRQKEVTVSEMQKSRQNQVTTKNRTESEIMDQIQKISKEWVQMIDENTAVVEKQTRGIDELSMSTAGSSSDDEDSEISVFDLELLTSSQGKSSRSMSSFFASFRGVMDWHV